jgi:hypothetical protein
LLFVGSGLYWILSSQLISSFTVLTPGLFASSSQGVALVLTVGVACLAIGLWIIPRDLEDLLELFNRNDGWVFIIPILLAVADISLTLSGLSSGKVAELNPLVASAIRLGPMILGSFVVSYMALSEGLGLLMLHLGKSLFPSNVLQAFPFALICAAAAFGPTSNFVLLALPSPQLSSYAIGGMGATLLASLIHLHFRRRELTTGTMLSN